MKQKVVLLGPPGAGKGTVASRVSAKTGLPQIATGDLLREAVAKGTGLGLKAKHYMDAGELVPDELVIGLLKEKIGSGGFLLDGFPRTIAQAEALEKISDVELVVNLVVPEEVIVRRMASRVTCRKCGEIYNTASLPPKQEGVCDKCGGELYSREDQKPEVVRERLRVYAEKTEPLVGHYRGKGVLVDIKRPEGAARGPEPTPIGPAATAHSGKPACLSGYCR